MIRKTLYGIFFILMFLNNSLFAGDWITSYEKLYRLSEDGKITKPVFLIVGRSSCHYCSLELSRIENSSNFKNFLFKNFTPVIVEEDIQMVPVDFQVENTPTIFVLDPYSLKPLIDPAQGAIPLNNLYKWLNTFIIQYKSFNSI